MFMARFADVEQEHFECTQRLEGTASRRKAAHSTCPASWYGPSIAIVLYVLKIAAFALKDSKPEFEVYDDSFMETQQSLTSLERNSNAQV